MDTTSATPAQPANTVVTPPRPNPIMKFFAYEHLPDRLRGVSADVCELARRMDLLLPDTPEKSAGLRKLLEAKDCFVRAQLPS